MLTKKMMLGSKNESFQASAYQISGVMT
ncbi:hypothetical protein LINGRAHAP2_LOCUS11526 [Linum grandiflorum]